MSKATREKRRQEQTNGIVPVTAVPPAALLKLDLGAGPRPREGFLGVDRLGFPGVDFSCDLAAERWYLMPRSERAVTGLRGVFGLSDPRASVEGPLPDASVEEAHSSHFVEHLTAPERVHFCNELYRVLVPGGKCTLIVPHWASCRAYGDPTHQWPPVSEFWFYYLSRAWRQANAPHTDREHWPEGFACDFDVTWGYTLNEALGVRSEETRQYAISWHKEAILDIQATLTAKKG